MNLLQRFLSKASGVVGLGRKTEEGALERYKAHVIGSGLDINQIGSDEQTMASFTAGGALQPPLPFDQLAALLLTSNALRQNIDAMITNIDGFGWRARPTVDLFGAIPEIKVAEMLWGMTGKKPTAKEIADTLEDWKAQALIERRKFIHFFKSISPEHTWVQVRKKLRQDYEQLGNAALEIVNNLGGQIGRVEHIPFITIRILPRHLDTIRVSIPQKVDEITIENRNISKRFFRYLQVQGGKMIYFKELGDPRVVSAMTGLTYETKEAMIAEEDTTSTEATEILHFSQQSMNNVYGMPRWIGNLTSVMGSRLSEEVNWMYFDNKGIPPMAIVFSGGRLSSDGSQAIADYIETSIKGQENFHRILVIEAETDNPDGKNLGKATVKFERLTDAQQQDALFQKYDKNNRMKVREAFRIPGLFLGDVEKIDRATAEMLKELTEEQVFEPERVEFDSIINLKLVPRLGFRFWEHDSLGPVPRNPKVVATIIERLVTVGVLMPDEARLMLPKILGIEIEHRTDEFLKEPIKLAIARLRARAQQARQGSGVPNLAQEGGDKPKDDDKPDQEEDQQQMKSLARDLAVLKRLIDGVQDQEIEAEIAKMLATDTATAL